MPRHNASRSMFFCRQCGHESPRWMGFCPACGERTPLVEAPTPKPSSPRGWIGAPTTQVPRELSDISTHQEGRISLGFREMDRVLGGGLVPGSLVLLAGEPGVGKSTLLLQAAGSVAGAGRTVLYVSSEESEQQIKLRAERLSLPGRRVFLLPETKVEQVVQQFEEHQPGLAIVDSIQTLSAGDISSGPGSVAQVRECTLHLMEWAKANGIPVLLTGHVTKDGTLAGPRVLEHMVDAVLYLEGENLGAHRILRSVKNRFGSTNEVAMFQMGGNGLEEIADPSQALLEERGPGAVGSAIVPVLEGSRPLMVEIQALTSPSVLPVPRRTANGVDYNRMIMVSAVLSRRARLSLSAQDIIVNVAGGLRVSEPGADLALALALASSLRNRPVKSGLAALGEVGLSGELRSVAQLERRLQEVVRLGFSRCILPASARGKTPRVEGLELLYAPTVGQAMSLGLERGAAEAPIQDKPASLAIDDGQ